MSIVDRLFRPAPMMEPAEDEAEEHLTEDERTLRLVEMGLHSGIVDGPYVKPVLWSADLPTRPGLYLIREPGADRSYWKVIDVWRGEKGLRCGWTDVEYRPLSSLQGWQFSRIPEPRP